MFEFLKSLVGLWFPEVRLLVALSLSLKYSKAFVAIVYSLYSSCNSNVTTTEVNLYSGHPYTAKG